MSDIDKELTAMKRIANALQSLDKPARLRVMTWMISAHEQDSAFEPDDEPHGLKEPEEPEEPKETKKASK